MQYPEMDGYILKEEASHHTCYRLFYGVRSFDKQPVIIKVANTLAADIALEKEDYLTRQSVSDHFLEVLAITDCEERKAIVYRRHREVALAQAIYSHVIDTEKFLRWAIGLATTLREIHRSGIILGNIHPACIFIDQHSQAVKFSGLSVRNDDGTYAIAIADTHPSVMAPEQFNQLAGRIDNRADYYALGAVLYELLTRRPLFYVQHRKQAIRRHLHSRPLAPSDLINTPKAISDIVMRLLEKRPEDRYQSLSALIDDLTYCLDMYQADREISTFPLAIEDARDCFYISKQLYERQAMLTCGQDLLQRTLSGEKTILFVQANRGSGKTAFVNALYPAILKHNMLCAYSVCQPIDRQQPYFPFMSVFDKLLARWLDELDEVTLERYRQTIHTAFGDQIGLLSGLIPRWRLFFGRTRDETRILDGPGQLQRFYAICLRLIRTLASLAAGFVCIIDDVDHMDADSMGLLEALVNENDLSSVMLILTYSTCPARLQRDLIKQSSSNTPVVLWNKVESKIHQIVLNDLSLSGVKQWIIDSFAVNHAHLVALSTIIFEKTQGNPYQIYWLLRQLHKEAILVFDVQKNRWNVDFPKVEAVVLSAEHAQKLFAKSVQGLPKHTQDILFSAACIEGQFSIDLLGKIMKLDGQSVLDALKPAVFSGIIAPIQKGGWFSDGYYFIDPSHAEWISQLLSDVRRQEIRGRILQIVLNDDQISLLDIAWPVMDAGILQTDLFAKRCVDGADAARHIGASCRVMQLVSKAIDILDDDWGTHHLMLWKLYLLAYESAFLLLDDVLARWYGQLLQSKAQTEAEYFELLAYRFSELDFLGHYQQMVTLAIQELEKLGIHAPTLDSSETYTMLWEEALARTEEKYLENWRQLDAPEATALYIAQIFSRLCYGFYFIGRLQVHARYTLLAFIYCSQTGVFTGIESVLVDFSMLCRISKHSAAAQRILLFGRSLAHSHHIPQSRLLAFSATFSDYWGHTLQQPEDFLAMIENLSTAENDVMALGIAYVGIFYATLGLSTPLSTCLSLAKKAVLVTQKKGGLLARFYAVLYRQFCLALSGKTSTLSSLESETFNRADFMSALDHYPILSDIRDMVYDIFTAYLQFFAGQYHKVYDVGMDIVCDTPYIQSMWFEVEYVFLYGMSSIRLFVQADTNEEKQAYYQALQKSIGYFKDKATHCPENFTSRYLVIKAASMFHDASFESAYAIWEEAMDACHQRGALKEEAILQFFFSDYLIEKNFVGYALSHLAGAIESFEEWEAFAEVDMLTKKFRQIVLSKGSTFPKSLGRMLDATVTDVLLNMVNQSAQQTSASAVESVLCDIWAKSASATTFFFVKNIEDRLIFSGYIGDKTNEYELMYKRNIRLFQATEFPKHFIASIAQYRHPISLSCITADTTEDAYLVTRKPASVIGIPLMLNQKLFGIIYLENESECDLYNDERVYFFEKIAALVVFLMDSAIQKDETQEQMIGLEENMKEKSTALSVLVSGVAHEMNTPIGNALTAASKIEEEAEQIKFAVEASQLSKGRLSKAIDVILEGIDITLSNLKRSGQLIQTFKQVSIDQTEEEKVTFDLIEYLYELVNHVDSLLSKKNIRLNLLMPAHLIVDSYPHAFSQIFSSLFTNAINHAFESREKGSIWIEITAQGDLLHISFKDNGVGMTEAVRTRIFDPFVTTKRSQGGSGLGAHIMYNLVTQRLAGQIKCYSKLGKGAEFVMKLPIRSP